MENWPIEVKDIVKFLTPWFGFKESMSLFQGDVGNFIRFSTMKNYIEIGEDQYIDADDGEIHGNIQPPKT